MYFNMILTAANHVESPPNHVVQYFFFLPNYGHVELYLLLDWRDERWERSNPPRPKISSFRTFNKIRGIEAISSCHFSG